MCLRNFEQLRRVCGSGEREGHGSVMGCVMSAEEKAQQQMSRRIDDELAYEMAHKKNEVKLLLLGECNHQAVGLNTPEAVRSRREKCLSFNNTRVHCTDGIS